MPRRSSPRGAPPATAPTGAAPSVAPTSSPRRAPSGARSTKSRGSFATASRRVACLPAAWPRIAVNALASHVRSLADAARVVPTYPRVSIERRDGRRLEGLVQNEGTEDLQLLTLDGDLMPLSRDEIARVVSHGRDKMPVLAATRRDRPVGRRRLADLQRRCVWQPTYGTAPDHRGQRRADAVEVDRAARRRAQLTDDAGGGRRRHVCDGAERSLRARCPQRPLNLAVRSAAHPWRHWRRGRRRQSRRGGARRPPVRGDRRCEASGAASG